MKTWDPDNDGTLDATEVNKAAGAKFDSLEGDHDGASKCLNAQTGGGLGSVSPPSA